jgi:hypothetical protein
MVNLVNPVALHGAGRLLRSFNWGREMGLGNQGQLATTYWDITKALKSGGINRGIPFTSLL